MITILIIAHMKNIYPIDYKDIIIFIPSLVLHLFRIYRLFYVARKLGWFSEFINPGSMANGNSLFGFLADIFKYPEIIRLIDKAAVNLQHEFVMRGDGWGVLEDLHSVEAKPVLNRHRCQPFCSIWNIRLHVDVPVWIPYYWLILCTSNHSLLIKVVKVIKWWRIFIRIVIQV